MAIDPAVLSSASALLGALAGGGASLLAAIYTQRYQDRLQRLARESAKRESVYADFIMTASAARLTAYVEDALTLSQEQQQLLGILQRIKLFAPPDVLEKGEMVIRSIIETATQPKLDLRGMTIADFEQYQGRDALDDFSDACRADLDDLHRGVR